MSVFRIQNNTPPVYTNESRDFQVLGRVMDAIHGGVMYDISSIVNLLRPLKIRDSLLPLYCGKVGFFPKHNINATALRYIVSTFPYMMRYKGSIRSIQYALAAILKAENIPANSSDPVIIVDNSEDYLLSIYIPFELQNKKALEEVLTYIVPAGYIIKIQQYTFNETPSDYIIQGSKLNIVTTEDSDSGLRKDGDMLDLETNLDLLKNSYDTGTVVAQEDIPTPDIGENQENE